MKNLCPIVRRLAALLLVLAPLLAATVCPAQVEFDFETPYLVQPGRQIWDFCLIQDQGLYHAYYHTFPQQTLDPASADTIWHAVSADLRHWDIRGPVLTAGPEWYDAEALWAPDVVFDPGSSRWAMLYTGVAAKMVQRPCLAWSDDLETWSKSPANPVFEPDSLVYHWAPSQAWSSFRDPFVYFDGSQWNMLSTAALRLGGYPGYRRAIIHRAVSSDLVDWQDAGAFYTHDGLVQTYDLESPQYVVRNGWHHLFFTEQDPNISDVPTSHMAARDPSGWTMAQRTYIDPGWAPEVDHFGPAGGPDLFARLAKDQDPRDDSWFITVKFDSVRYEDGGMTPVVFSADYLADWPVRTGTAAVTVPTFGDNPVLRGDFSMQPEGHGWFSSRENYGGPLGGIGEPGGALETGAVGMLLSRQFVLARDYLGVMTVCGATGAAVHVALEDADTGVELDRLVPYAAHPLQERMWNVSPFLGRSVRLRIVDEDTAAGGWIAVDRIRGMDGPSAAEPAPATRVRAAPNPFNGGTVIGLDLPAGTQARIEIFDLQGRRVWRSRRLTAGAGRLDVTWNAVDDRGRRLPSGTYAYRVLTGDRTAATGRLTLVK